MATNRTYKTHRITSLPAGRSPSEHMTPPRVNADTIIYISTVNARSLSEESKLQELEYALRKIIWEIIGLSEIGRNYEAITIRKSGATFIHGPAENSQFGVCLYVKKVGRNQS